MRECINITFNALFDKPFVLNRHLALLSCILSGYFYYEIVAPKYLATLFYNTLLLRRSVCLSEAHRGSKFCDVISAQRPIYVILV